MNCRCLTIFCIAVLSFTLTSRAQAAGPTTQIVWLAPTNAWPEKLWEYKSIPQRFSEATISNLLAATSFTPKEQAAPPEYLLKRDARALYFGTSWAKHLTISPLSGYIEYHDQSAQTSMTSSEKGVPEPVVGVPDQEQTTRLGLKYMRLLALDVSQFARKSGTEDFDLHWDKGGRAYLNEKTGRRVEDEPDNFGVFFDRRIDGLNVKGIGLNGGLFISFGNNAKIIDLKLSWRNLEPFELCTCPSPEKVEKWIRNGSVVCNPKWGFTGEAPLKISISRIAFLYDGSIGDDPMHFVFPFAIFDAILEGPHGTNTVQFRCPMTFSKENWNVIK